MTLKEVSQRANEAAQRICEVLLPNGRRVGKEWIVGDVAGSAGDSMHVQLEGPKQGLWYDHAAGIGGDMLKLVELSKGLQGVIAAADEVRKILGLPEWRPDRNRKPAAPVYDPCTKAWKLKHNQEWVHPTKSWTYTDAAGAVLAYVCRIDWVENGKAKKDVLPQRTGDDGKWHWKGYKGDEKRPVYGLHRLARQDDGRPLLIVEGEKTADAAAKLFPGACVTTWMGGCKNVSKSDWDPVTNWKGPIVVWPDNDDEGQGAALYLCGRFPKARKVLLPAGLPPGWDLADPIPEGVSVRGLFDASLHPAAKSGQGGSAPETRTDASAVQVADSGSIARLELLYGPPVFHARDGRGVGLNERFFAGLLAEETRLLFDADEGRFYRYHERNGLWVGETADAVRNMLGHSMLRYLRERGEDQAIRRIQNRTTTASLAELRGIVEKRRPFQPAGGRIHVANGVLDLSQGDEPRLLPFSPDFLSRNHSPIPYVPEANCPRFLSELIGPVLAPDDALAVQRIAGLALLGRNLPQRILLLHGEGGTSKGTVVRVIGLLVGHENLRELRTEHLEERFEINRLAGGTLLLGQDVAANFLERPGASMLKKLVGGDYLDGEPKGRNGLVRLEGVFNVIITCNSRLRVHLEGDHSAWRRRLILVEFQNSPPRKRVADFEKVLLAEEGPGILGWAIEGAVRALREQDETGDLRLSSEQASRVERLLNESDSARLFIGERIQAQEGGNVTVQEAVTQYFRFCRAHDFASCSQRQVENALPSLLAERFGVTRSNDIVRSGKAQRGWRGISIAALDDRPEDFE